LKLGKREKECFLPPSAPVSYESLQENILERIS
jgi:hypothetical protein